MDDGRFFLGKILDSGEHDAAGRDRELRAQIARPAA